MIVIVLDKKGCEKKMAMPRYVYDELMTRARNLMEEAIRQSVGDKKENKEEDISEGLKKKYQKDLFKNATLEINSYGNVHVMLDKNFIDTIQREFNEAERVRQKIKDEYYEIKRKKEQKVRREYELQLQDWTLDLFSKISNGEPIKLPVFKVKKI